MIWLCFPGSCWQCGLCMPIPSLRVLLRCQASWSQFFGMMAFLLASCVFGARGTLLGWTLTAHTFLQHVMGGGVNPEHSLMCLFICWPDKVMALRQVPHMQNSHCNARWQCGWGRPDHLDGVHTEWATWHAWLVPILGFIRLVERDASKCALHMQFLQQPQWGNRATLEHHNDVWPLLNFWEEQETLDMFCTVASGFGGASVDTFAGSTW